MLYQVGLCQFQPKLLQKKENLQKMINLVDGIEADLIVFPELATSGYTFASQEEVFSVAESFAKGETTMIFQELSAKNKTSYVIGFPENYNEQLFNSSVLINPDGTKHLYRKTHLFNEEKLWFTPGDTGFVVANAKNEVRVGLMICFDWFFPESARTIMLKGGQIIAHCANLVLPWCQQAMLTRSLENRLYSITCNRTGTEINGEKTFSFTGMSQVISPLGDILFRLNNDDEKVNLVKIDITKANDKNITAYNHVIKDLRTNFYWHTNK